ncbi:YidH family protein [Saccharomonospora saliphila]|uniref:YidH family protein n=1 Tax=Saccharomonospora saliphila TaxID=369829 RepID=UPI000367CDE6|nr:DUF202 domain-containing protein [Saccharomonospora saliphila]
MYDEPWDPGLQIERTSLAWLRTALAILVGIAIAIRILAYHEPGTAIVVAVGFVPLATFLSWRAWRRYRCGERNLRAQAPLPDGVLPAGFTVLACAAGCMAIGYAVLVPRP